MKTAWDYTNLADAYLKRPDYSADAVNYMLKVAGVNENSLVCDVGAGVAHLTIELANRGIAVSAVEPNDAMRANGIRRTSNFKKVTWFEGTGEETNQPTGSFDMLTFGSSFNVTDRITALKETHRILKKNRWFACLWNHRNIDDPIQSAIEAIIKKYIPNYDYGTRREDQTEIIKQSGLFQDIRAFDGSVLHTQSKVDCLEAWRSHATLHRQAGKNFLTVIEEIEELLSSVETNSIVIPYTTRGWMAQAV